MPTTLALTRNTAEPATLHAVQINNQLIAIYETAEPLAATQAVQQTLSLADAPIRAVELEVQYRAQNIVARCVPPKHRLAQRWRLYSMARSGWIAVGKIDWGAVKQRFRLPWALQIKANLNTPKQNFPIIHPLSSAA